MSRSNVVDLESLEGWAAGRDAAFAEMRAAGADALFPLLVPMLAGDAEARCTACNVVLRVDAERGLELVLRLLNDPDDGVRSYACECLAECGGKGAVPAWLQHRRAVFGLDFDVDHAAYNRANYDVPIFTLPR